MWAGGGGHTKHSLNAPLGVPSRCGTPRLARHYRNFYLANLVGNTTTTANSGIHSLSGSTPPPGSLTPDSSTFSDQRCHRHTSTGVRRPRTAHTSASVGSAGSPGLIAARSVLTTSLSLGPRDVFPADSSTEDSTKSPRSCQEPPVPTPAPRSRATRGTACSSEFLPPPHTLNAVGRDSQGASSRASRRHVHPPGASSQSTLPHTFSGIEVVHPRLPRQRPTQRPPLHPHQP